MNKKRLTILLSSIVAGAGLVGATFAGWAVTDSADPFGVKISPNDIQDDSYNRLVLEWGDKTEFTNVGNLGLGETNAQYISLGVKATSSDNSDTGGNLSISLEDRTTGRAGTPEKLIDHLVVKVYSTRSENQPYTYTNEITDLKLDGTGTPKLSASKDISTPRDGTEKTLYFKVYIDSTGLDAAKYAEMKKDVVFLTADWNRPSTITDDDLTGETYTIYYESNKQPYVYAWNQTTLAANGDFPGDAMTIVEGETNLYSYELKTTFDQIIFSDGQAGEGHQTVNINVPTASEQSAGKFFYDGSKWDVVPETEDVEYWLIGSMNNWTSGTTGYQFTLDDMNSERYWLNLHVAANQDMKVITGDNMHYWGENTKGTSDQTTVFHIGDEGDYTFAFYPNGKNGTNVYLACE